MEPWGDMSYEMKIYKRSQNEKTRWTQWTQDDLLSDSDGDQLLESPTRTGSIMYWSLIVWLHTIIKWRYIHSSRYFPTMTSLLTISNCTPQPPSQSYRQSGAPHSLPNCSPWTKSCAGGHVKWTENGDPLRSWGNGDSLREMVTISSHVSTIASPINIKKNGKETWS